MDKKKVTLEDVAKATNLSTYAVSRAISGKSGISESTRARVMAACEELGYLKASPKEGPRYLLMCIPQSDIDDATFWMKVLQGIESAATKEGLALHVKVIQPFVEAQIDSEIKSAAGVFYAGHKCIAAAQKYLRLSRPSLLMTYPPESLFEMDTIHTGDREAAYALCDKLIEWGHKRIAFLGTTERPSTLNRLEGAKEAMDKAGLKLAYLWTQQKHSEAEWMRSELTRLRNAGEMPTAIMCSSEGLAQSLIFVLGSMQIAVPGEISVTGFNIDHDDRSSIPLTGTAFDKFDYGRLAFKYLNDRIENPNSAFNRITVLPSLLLRATAERLVPENGI
jgi:LacI family transcriptional regulator